VLLRFWREEQQDAKPELSERARSNRRGAQAVTSKHQETTLILLRTKKSTPHHQYQKAKGEELPINRGRAGGGKQAASSAREDASSLRTKRAEHDSERQRQRPAEARETRMRH